MENTYGIGVANRYSLFLDEEEDPLEVLKIQELERETKRKSKHVEKENKIKNAEPKTKAIPLRKVAKDTQNAKVASTTRPSPPEPSKTKDDSTKTKVNPKNVKFLGDGREDRNNRRNRDERFHQVAGDNIRDGPRDGPRDAQGRGSRGDMTTGTRDGPRESSGRGFRTEMSSGPREGQSHGPRNDISGEDRRGRGMGPRGTGPRGRGYRGISGNRGSYDNKVKRDYDRPYIGTGKTDLPHTTEAPSNEWEAEPPPPMEVVASDTITAPIVTEEEAETPIPAEEEPRELTLDEYKALRSGRQKPTYNLRKAGEGEDLTQWNNMYELSKKKDEAEHEEDEPVEYDALEYPQRVGRQKLLLSIDIHFTDTRRGVRSRGGRGAPRGSRGGVASATRTDEPTRVARGRGDHQGFRGERGVRYSGERGFRGDRDRADHTEPYRGRGAKQNAPKVDDEHDFPSLG